MEFVICFCQGAAAGVGQTSGKDSLSASAWRLEERPEIEQFRKFSSIFRAAIQPSQEVVHTTSVELKRHDTSEFQKPPVQSFLPTTEDLQDETAAACPEHMERLSDGSISPTSRCIGDGEEQSWSLVRAREMRVLALCENMKNGFAPVKVTVKETTSPVGRTQIRRYQPERQDKTCPETRRKDSTND